MNSNKCLLYLFILDSLILLLTRSCSVKIGVSKREAVWHNVCHFCRDTINRQVVYPVVPTGEYVHLGWKILLNIGKYILKCAVDRNATTCHTSTEDEDSKLSTQIGGKS